MVFGMIHATKGGIFATKGKVIVFGLPETFFAGQTTTLTNAEATPKISQVTATPQTKVGNLQMTLSFEAFCQIFALCFVGLLFEGWYNKKIQGRAKP